VSRAAPAVALSGVPRWLPYVLLAVLAALLWAVVRAIAPPRCNGGRWGEGCTETYQNP